MFGLVRARVSYQGQQQVAFGARRLLRDERQKPWPVCRIEYVCLLRDEDTRAVAAFALRFGRAARPLGPARNLACPELRMRSGSYLLSYRKLNKSNRLHFCHSETIGSAVVGTYRGTLFLCANSLVSYSPLAIFWGPPKNL